MKIKALQKESSRFISASLSFVLRQLMDEVLDKAKIRMTPNIIDNFINFKIKNNLKLAINNDGSIEKGCRCKK